MHSYHVRVTQVPYLYTQRKEGRKVISDGWLKVEGLLVEAEAGERDMARQGVGAEGHGRVCDRGMVWGRGKWLK